VQDIDSFVDEQIEKRHRPQLQNYGALMSELDDRPIKLAIYFPMLAKLRSWDYRA
jgi:ATP-dependent helicase/nuclease subunit A